MDFISIATRQSKLYFCSKSLIISITLFLTCVMDRGAWQATVHRVAELDTTEVTLHTHTHTHTHTRDACQLPALETHRLIEALYNTTLLSTHFCHRIILLSFPGGSDGKESARHEGDPGLFPGWGRSPGEGNGKTLQYSCLGNSMDGGA